MKTPAERASAFQALHRAKPGFVMPNAWDAGSAILLAQAGFSAIATTSAGIAFSMGKQDYRISDRERAVSRDAMFERIREIVEAVSIPVSGDLEAGYGDKPEAVAATIALAIDTGLAGANIEDKMPFSEALYDEALAVERIAAARETIGDAPFVLTARTDALQLDPDGGLGEAIRRSNLYRKAGADCLYAPGRFGLDVAARLAHEIEGPINVVIGLGGADGVVADLLAAGVQRISLGGSIARSALGFVRAAACELRASGTIRFAQGQIQQAELNRLFAAAR